jgi:hypothetical protein
VSRRIPFILRFFWKAFVWIFLLLTTAWAFGAIWFDLPAANWRHLVAILFLCGAGATLIVVRTRARAQLIVFFAFGLILLWWRTLQPSNDRSWQPDVAETAWAEIKGDEVVLHNVRNCDYRTESEYVPHWETRALRLSQVNGLDLAITYWGSPYMAHPIVSFHFDDAPPLSFSIETRKEVGENYSALAGLYRHYELIYICADERDVLRLRTNYRQGEDVYLYRAKITPERARRRFLEYIDTLNNLRAQPRWYNALTTNCTTAIREQHPADERIPWDWRLLVNGKADELMYERGVISSGDLSFAELKRRSLINQRAQTADKDPAFSQLIRQGLPGFASE